MSFFVYYIYSHYLTILIMTPLFSAMALTIIPAENKKRMINLSVFLSIIIFFFSLGLYAGYDGNNIHIQFAEQYTWINDLGISYFVGIDGISVFLVLLTCFLFPLVMLQAADSIKNNLKLYLISMFILETSVIGTFVSLDLILFYVFFELILIPMTLLIIYWGGENRVYAGIKFFIFTMAGSIFMLFGILALMYIYYNSTGHPSSSLLQIFTLKIDSFKIQTLLFFSFAISFAIKIPMFPFHTWLPDAHTEAPTGGSVILAGILLKVGAYGFLRFAIPLFPEAVNYFSTLFIILGIIGIIYGALIAMIQTDIKKLIAYSSVSHMGYVIAGLFALNLTGVSGSIVQMINHGLSTSALFLLVGILYEKRHTRLISDFGGIASIMPKYTFIFFIIMLSSIAMPGLNGFIGEFMILAGVFNISIYLGIFSTIGAILGAAYMLWMFERVFLGEITLSENSKLKDITKKEILPFIPLIIMILVIGLYPSLITSKINSSVDYLIRMKDSNYTLKVDNSDIHNINFKSMKEWSDKK